MPGQEVTTLAGVGWAELAAAFTLAFADYAVPMQMTAAALERMQRRRGYDPTSSFGAWEGGALVGFVLTCRDGGRAYNSGTGVAPEHRKSGVARRLLDAAITTIGDAPYVLEVLDTNARAIAFYQRAGFAERRRLQCWSYTGPREPMSRVDLAPDGELEPAWQNSRASIARAIEPFETIGTDDGAAVVFTSNGDLPLLAVRSVARRHGLGRRLLAGASAAAGTPLRILNVDSRATEVAAFLDATCTRTVGQLEMVRGRVAA